MTSQPAITVHFDRDELVRTMQHAVHSPLSGLVRTIGWYPAGLGRPRFHVDHIAVATDPVTTDAPPATAGGLFPSESRIRALGLAIERYSEHSFADGQDELVLADDLLNAGASRSIPRQLLWTGPAATASHIVAAKALLLALRRLVAQLPGERVLLALDERTRVIERVVQQRIPADTQVEFILAAPGPLPAFTATCRLVSRGRLLGEGTVNHGALNRALYESLLQAAADEREGRWSGRGWTSAPAAPTTTVSAARLPPDSTSLDHGTSLILDAFRDGGHQLFAVDLTTDDVRTAGLRVLRVCATGVSGTRGQDVS